MASRLFTARLSDTEYRAFQEKASGSSMAELLRGWIRDAPEASPASVHRACDEQITSLQREVDRLRRQVSTPAVDTSTVPGLEIHGLLDLAAEAGAAIVGGQLYDSRGITRDWGVHGTRPSFVAAPDDDCAACGHDRHRWVQEGVCKAPVGRGTCGCTDFATREELTF